MEDRRIEELKEKLDRLVTQQHQMSKEIRDLQVSIDSLSNSPEKQEKTSYNSAAIVTSSVPKKELINSDIVKQSKPKVKRDLEQFIGENLISKLGILITVIGVGIGSKYAFDNNMINPLTRIILGYVVSLGLLGTALFLRKKYTSFSAVLLSGSLAIMYLLTFSAYNFYDFIGKGPSFGIMVFLTIATVYAALKYDRPIIGHLGLVGSYAIPFLLSDGSGQVLYLLIYMAIINAGILVVSIKKYWQSLYYAALIFTWIIFTVWFIDQYSHDDFAVGITFASLFYILFYAAFLGNKILYKKAFSREDIFLLLSNSLIFYALGFALFNKQFDEDYALGAFTFMNSLVHLLVALMVKRLDKDNEPLFRLIIGLAIVYITLTIPVLFEGTWITVLWIGEAVALTWAGQNKEGLAYKRMSYALILLTFLSLLAVWESRSHSTTASIIANKYFLVSILSSIGLAIINWLNQKSHVSNAKWYERVMYFITPGIFILSVYVGLLLEINAFWDHSGHPMDFELKKIWIMTYSLCFISTLGFISYYKIRNEQLANVIFALIFLTVPYLLNTTLSLNHLRTYYLERDSSMMILSHRYVLFLSIASVVISIKPFVTNGLIKDKLKVAFDLLFLCTILWISSIELIHWLDLGGFKSSDKLALSILWGASALVWVGIGFRHLKKHIRVAAISLFGIALLKLFFYDISHLNMLSKTIVFILLGVLMLGASYLYNRFKQNLKKAED